MTHTVKGFGIINKAEVDVFLEHSCFFNDPVNVGNLISGSSAFSKSSLNIWKFTVHILLKPGLENFEHYLLACEMSAIVCYFEHSLALPFFGIGMKTDLFQSCGHSQLSKFADILSAALSQHHLPGFDIAQWGFHHLHKVCSQWCFLRPTLFHIPGCLALGEWSHCHDYLGCDDIFCIVLLCILAASP